ncbi:MAG: hypothetical protein V4654_10175 [Bdellovibrionota bacterium]
MQNSLIQSLSTAVLSVLFGFFGALGLLQSSGRTQRLLKFLALVPVFLPSLFSLLIGISIINFFPMGTFGVIYFLTLIYIGFAASVLCEEMTSQLGQTGFVAEVYGLSKRLFLFKVLWPMVRKSVGFVFITIFVNAMMAFTIPLLVGGGRGTNFEVLIYEKIFIEQNWSAALGLSLLQLALIAIFALLLQARPVVSVSEFKKSRLVGSYFGLAGLVLYLSLYFWGYIKLFGGSLQVYYFADIFNADFYTSISQSLLLFAFCFVIFFALLLAVLFLKYSLKDTRFLNFFLNPSSVLVGFGFYLLLPSHNLWYSLLKLSLVIGVVSFVGFMKFVFENQLQLFETQIKVARSFGLGFLSFVFTIYFPQIKKRIHYAISLLFIFCISEFGLVKASGAEVKTLGTVMASYLSSYRIEGAFVISTIILAIWLVAMVISGVALGVHQKS